MLSEVDKATVGKIKTYSKAFWDDDATCFSLRDVLNLLAIIDRLQSPSVVLAEAERLFAAHGRELVLVDPAEFPAEDETTLAEAYAALAGGTVKP